MSLESQTVRDGMMHKPDVFRVTWEFMVEDRSFSRDVGTLDEAIALAAAHWPASIEILETQPGGELMLLGIWRMNFTGRHWAPARADR